MTSIAAVRVEVQMADVPASVLVSYARFLEVRARRLDIVTELTQPDEQRTNDVAGGGDSITIAERTRVTGRVLAMVAAAGSLSS